jgi:hypothetical protein
MLHYNVHVDDLRRAYESHRHIQESEKFDARKLISAFETKRAESKFAPLDTDIEGQKKIIQAAKNNDRDAINYIYLKCATVINQTFWKNYLGPSGRARKARIDSGAWYEWGANAFQTLVGGFKEYRESSKGAIELFDETKYTEGDLWKAFRFRFYKLLINTSKEANVGEITGGMKDVGGMRDSSFTNVKVQSYDPAWQDSVADEYSTDDDDNGGGGPGYEDETFTRVSNSMALEAFMPAWRKFVQSPAIAEGRYGVTPALVFKAVLENPSLSQADLEKRYGSLSHNTIRKYLNVAVEALKANGITQHDLSIAVKDIGADKLASYIVAEEPVAKQKADTSDSTLAKFQSFADDPRLWNSAKKGWSAGPIMVEWILDNNINLEQLARDIPLNFYIDYYWKRCLKMLKQKGLSLDDVKALSKKYGKKKIAGMIGDIE